MKIIVTVEKGIFVEVQPNEGQEQISFTDIIGSLEFAKQLVLKEWNAKLEKDVASE